MRPRAARSPRGHKLTPTRRDTFVARTEPHRQGGIADVGRIAVRAATSQEARRPGRFGRSGLRDTTHRGRRKAGLPRRDRIVHHDLMFTSEAATRGVRVAVVAEFVAGAVARRREAVVLPLHDHDYQQRVGNGAAAVAALDHHRMPAGHVEEVTGPGVVGEQPVLEPGESFTYTSGCPLSTSFGTMEGTYQMVTKAGESFDAKVAPVHAERTVYGALIQESGSTGRQALGPAQGRPLRIDERPFRAGTSPAPTPSSSQSACANRGTASRPRRPGRCPTRS